MDGIGELRFMGTTRPKAKPISDDLWRRHEPEIRELHSTMTVERLAEHMDRVHKFKATPRQYGSKFDQWELKKYNKRRSVSAPAIMQSTEATDLNLQTKDSRAAEMAEFMQGFGKHGAKDATSDLPDTKRCKVEYTASHGRSALWAYVESSKRDSKPLTPTLISSLNSSDSCYGDFKEASQAMRPRASFDDMAVPRTPFTFEFLPYRET